MIRSIHQYTDDGVRPDGSVDESRRGMRVDEHVAEPLETDMLSGLRAMRAPKRFIGHYQTTTTQDALVNGRAVRRMTTMPRTVDIEAETLEEAFAKLPAAVAADLERMQREASGLRIASVEETATLAKRNGFKVEQ